MGASVQNLLSTGSPKVKSRAKRIASKSTGQKKISLYFIFVKHVRLIAKGIFSQLFGEQIRCNYSGFVPLFVLLHPIKYRARAHSNRI